MLLLLLALELLALLLLLFWPCNADVRVSQRDIEVHTAILHSSIAVIARYTEWAAGTSLMNLIVA